MTAGNIGNIGNVGSGYSYVPDVDALRESRQVTSNENNQQLNAPVAQPQEKPDVFTPDTGERPDFAAINLIRNSMPDPLVSNRIQTYTVDDFMEGAPANRAEAPQTQRTEQLADAHENESATVQTSQEIAERDSGNRLTPAQERGVEEYVRVQNYADPGAVSNAGAQIVA